MKGQAMCNDESIPLADRLERDPLMKESGALLMPPVTRGEMRAIIAALRSAPSQLRPIEKGGKDESALHNRAGSDAVTGAAHPQNAALTRVGGDNVKSALLLAQSALRRWTDLYAHLQNECGEVVSRKLDYNLPPADHVKALEAVADAISALSSTQRKEGNELRLSDGGIDQPLCAGEPAAWLVENPKGEKSVTLKNAQAPEFWIGGKIADGYKVTPLFAASAIVCDKDLRDALMYAKQTLLVLSAGKPVRDLDEQVSWINHLLTNTTDRTAKTK